MPKKPIEQLLANANQDEKEEIFAENAKEKHEAVKSKINKTIQAQEGKLDKLWTAIYYSVMRDTMGSDKSLTDQERVEFGTGFHKKVNEERQKTEAELGDKAVSAVIPDPPTLAAFREFYQLIGMTQGKCAHMLSKEHAEIKKGLSNELDPGTRDDLADVLVLTGEGLSGNIERYATNMMSDMLQKTSTAASPNGEPIEYDYVLKGLLAEDFKKHLGPDPLHPTMTVAEFMDLSHMSPADREGFLKKTKCKPEDNLYDHMFEGVRKDLKANDRKKSVEEQRALCHDRVLFEMTNAYESQIKRGWMNEGREQYKKGLQKTEQKEFENGQRLQNLIGKGFGKMRDSLEEKNQDCKKLAEPIIHDNKVKTLKFVTEKLTSQKPLGMRQEPGLTEAITSGSGQKLAERAHVTRGAIRELESTGSTWEYHSKNSKTYDKMVQSLKDYHKALAAGEGGKALDLRNDWYRNAIRYVTGKESKRREIHGQTRFDSVMTMLYNELKPEEFQKLLNEVNSKRSDADRLTVEMFAHRKQSYIEASRTEENAIQEKTRNNATDIPYRYILKVVEMDELYAPKKSENQIGNLNGAVSEYPAIGLKDTADVHSQGLSNKDFAALAFANALSSKNRESHLIENDLLIQNETAVEDGKKAADIAFKAYGNKDKIPLANLLSLGIRKLNQTAQESADAEEKACMQEMAKRMTNMLERDPELQKYAMRQGLKQEEIESVQKLAAPRERTGSLVDIEAEQIMKK